MASCYNSSDARFGFAFHVDTALVDAAQSSQRRGVTLFTKVHSALETDGEIAIDLLFALDALSAH